MSDALSYMLLMLLFVPFLGVSVYAQTQQYDIFVASDHNTPGCHIDNSCWSDSNIMINQYDTIIWSNNALYSISITSGDLLDDDVGSHFDSGVLLPGREYSYIFEDAGTFTYFSVLQPWMTGVIIVNPSPVPDSYQSSSPDSEPTIPESKEPICGSGTKLVNGFCQVIQSESKEPICGSGTKLVNGFCQVIQSEPEPDSGCLIATAAYGTELAPQVQLLREIRDNTLFSTTFGTSFMMGFNTLYYSFAPTVADWERENPTFKETVNILITPMIFTLSIMSLANEGSEVEVLGFGLSVIALNLGMYITAPAIVVWQVKKII